MFSSADLVPLLRTVPWKTAVAGVYPLVKLIRHQVFAQMTVEGGEAARKYLSKQTDDEDAVNLAVKIIGMMKERGFDDAHADRYATELSRAVDDLVPKNESAERHAVGHLGQIDAAVGRGIRLREQPRPVAADSLSAPAVNGQAAHDDPAQAPPRARRLLKWAEVLLTPIVVAIVGAFGSVWIANHQERSSRDLQKDLHEAQRETSLLLQKNQAEASDNLQRVQLASAERIARATQQAKLLEIFATQIVSPNAASHAVHLLRALDPELGVKLAEGIATDESQPLALRQEARVVFQGLKVLNKSRFTSFAESCRDKPKFSVTAQGVNPDEAERKCSEAASISSPTFVDGAWKWSATLGPILLTCTCTSSQ